MDAEKLNITQLTNLQIQQLKPSENNSGSLKGTLQIGTFSQAQTVALGRSLVAIEAKDPDTTRGVLVYITDGDHEGINLWTGTRFITLGAGGAGGGNVVADGEFNAGDTVSFVEKVSGEYFFRRALLGIGDLFAQTPAPEGGLTEDEPITTDIYNLRIVQFGNINATHAQNTGSIMLDALIVATIYNYIDNVATGFGSGISEPSSSESATLELNTTDGALLVSRLTEAQKLALKNPVDGMIIYNSTNKEFEFRKDGVWSNSAGAGDVLGPDSSVANNFVSFVDNQGKKIKDSGIAAGAVGDVKGPTGTTVVDAIAAFSSTTGKAIKDSGITINTIGNVKGPTTSVVSGDIVVFDTTTGKAIKDSGVKLPTSKGNASDFLQTDGNGNTVWAAVPSNAQSNFYSSVGTYTWRKNPGTTKIRILMIGGGGGGAVLSGTGSISGGAGGAFYDSGVLDVPANITSGTLTIGAGGERTYNGQNTSFVIPSMSLNCIASGGANGHSFPSPSTPGYQPTKGYPDITNNQGGGGGWFPWSTQTIPDNVLPGQNAVYGGGGGGASGHIDQVTPSNTRNAGKGGNAALPFFNTTGGAGSQNSFDINVKPANGGDGQGWMPQLGEILIAGGGGGGGAEWVPASGQANVRASVGGNGGLFGGGGGGSSVFIEGTEVGGKGAQGAALIYQW